MVDSDRTGAAHVGVVGLAVMGSNLARNFARHGRTVALYNRTQARTDALMADHGAEGTSSPRPRWRTSWPAWSGPDASC